MTDIRKTVIAALDKSINVLRDPEIGPRLLKGEDVAFDDMELDSLSVFEVLMFVEEELGIELETDEIEDIETVNGLVDFLTNNARAA